MLLLLPLLLHEVTYIAWTIGKHAQNTYKPTHLTVWCQMIVNTQYFLPSHSTGPHFHPDHLLSSMVFIFICGYLVVINPRIDIELRRITRATYVTILYTIYYRTNLRMQHNLNSMMHVMGWTVSMTNIFFYDICYDVVSAIENICSMKNAIWFVCLCSLN